MSVRVQVSSMKTSRSASTRPWYFVHWARRRATSGRSRSPATTLFFEAELLGMHEVPHRMVVDLQAATGKLGNETAYGEIAVLDPLRQPDRVVRVARGSQAVGLHLEEGLSLLWRSPSKRCRRLSSWSVDHQKLQKQSLMRCFRFSRKVGHPRSRSGYAA